jgi:hypothetical protein
MEAAIEAWDQIKLQLKTISEQNDLVNRMEILLVKLIHIVHIHVTANCLMLFHVDQ